MILVFFLCLIYHLITVLLVCNGERRIIGGKDVTSNHTHMVYIIKAEHSTKTYSGWLCGGALVGRRIVITSAACVRDVEHMYVIAGYGLYVTDNERDNDTCIQNMKRKVINVCVPKDYKLVYEALEEWANYDIAVIKVDADITGVAAYSEHCHYVPQAIDINYNNKELQDTGKDALILGWGHKEKWRKDKDLTDLNQKVLQYGSTMIYDKKKCVQKYTDYKIDSLINTYMICTWPPAAFNDQGELGEEIEKLNGDEGLDGCDDDKGNGTDQQSNPGGGNDSELENKQSVGICQNDHGGPLVSWQRSKPKIIGVASVFRVNDENDCMGPFLFTSTYCSSKFLKCVIYEFGKDEAPQAAQNGNATRRAMPNYCHLPPAEKGFDIIERRISWLHHPDGPAENEKYQLRPQIPVRDFLH